MRPLPPRPDTAPSDAEPTAETESSDVPASEPEPDPAPAALPERRWHYRRSLASRVTLLTTIAVGVAVAFLSLSVYLVVRIQLDDTMDEQLLDRATSMAAGLTPAVADGDLDQLRTQLRFLPPDSRVQIVLSDGTPCSGPARPRSHSARRSSRWRRAAPTTPCCGRSPSRATTSAWRRCRWRARAVGSARS
ncbi:hypothetical protein [Nocardioides zeae]